MFMKLKVIVLDPELSPSARNRILAAAALVLIGIGGMAIAAPELITWSDGDTLRAADLNRNFEELAVEIARIDASIGTYVNPDTGTVWTSHRGYCGSTAATTGQLGGLRGAKSMCEAACGTPGAHMCTIAEVQRSWTTGSDVPEDAWVDGPLPNLHSYFQGAEGTPVSLRACLQWGNEYGSEVGMVTNIYPRTTDNPGGPTLGMVSQPCNTSRPALCCD
jgi:hypothetical protein